MLGWQKYAGQMNEDDQLLPFIGARTILMHIQLTLS